MHLAIVALLSLLIASRAAATNQPQPAPQQQVQGQTQAQGQIQGQTQGSQSLTDSDRSSYRSWAVLLPSAPWMPPMARVECASAQIDQSDQQVLWGACGLRQMTTGLCKRRWL